SALFLATGRLALAFPRGWTTTKGLVLLLTTVLGFLATPALVFGAVSFRSPGRVTRRVAMIGLGAAVILGVLTLVTSLLWSDPLTSFSLRHGVRTLVFAPALFFCAFVFLERVRHTKSGAALVTGAACFAYGIDQCIYAVVQLTQVVTTVSGAPAGTGRLAVLASAKLLYLDVILTGAICLGMVLLLVDEYQRSERALKESVDRGREVADENTALQLEIRIREETERLLRASEDRYRDLVEHSEDLVCIHDLEGRILSVNPAPARILGYSVEEVLTKNARDILAPDVRGDFDEYINAIQRDGVATGVLKVMTRTGEHRFWAFRNTLRSDGVNAPIVRGMARDVTEQLKAEKALRHSEQKFTVAFRSSPCVMAMLSEDGRFLDVNATFVTMTGYSREEVLNRTSLDVGLWADPETRATIRRKIDETGRLDNLEIDVRCKDGRIAPMVFAAELVQIGRDRLMLVAGLDVTARKEAEARHQAILKTLPDWVFLTNRDGVLLESHAKDQRLTMVPPRELVGLNVTEVMPRDLAKRVMACLHTTLRSDQTATLEYSRWMADEERFFELRSVRFDRDQVLSLVRDVTDQRRAEHRARELQEELTHAGRVMALGTLSGSLAHEVNQPLTAITMNAYAALRLLETEEPHVEGARDALRDIMSDGRRIDDVLRRMRGLLRKERKDYGPVDVNAVVSDVLKLVHSDFIERRISIELATGSNIPVVYGDRVQLQQVVLNILLNAAEAVGEADNAEDRIVTLTTAAIGTQVTVSVSDRGEGISGPAFDRMFDPFFTTKRDGMGLGLSICRTIMDAHGGRISARRNADRGLTCWFVLDAARMPARISPKGIRESIVVEAMDA
ncbi:MAG TPA: PAS domain S-box protein, partial [Gemmatimonadaceae bacterium]|nr:PAS domain S-box protein [Gemmatimonadaceae bacterium]